MTAALMDAASLTRRLNFSSLPADALLRLSVRQFDDAAAAKPLARPRRHLAAAQTLMALGLFAEAESLLHMAADQDPQQAASADTQTLTAIAALLAGRPEEAGALTDPKLDGTDEVALWRAVRQAMQDQGSPGAAAVFAATAPLVFQYPAPIRDHILPLIAETMVQGGAIEAAAHVLDQRKNDPKLAYARALLRQAEGDTGQALTMLDALANGHDQFDRARAAVRAVELRLATHQLDKTQAADALDKLLYAWRGDSRELALRERVADLRGQTGAWREALASLRRAETDFPEQAVPLSQRLKDTFVAMIRDQDAHPMPPIEFVSTIEENTDLLPDPGDDEAVEQPLADRLLALDLPDRAKPVLEKLLKQAKSAVAKARFGDSLATLDAREGDDAGAIAVLAASQNPSLPDDLAERRLILQANAVAR
jgi:tetratricopeptide (TPR) repeat protein